MTSEFWKRDYLTPKRSGWHVISSYYEDGEPPWQVVECIHPTREQAEAQIPLIAKFRSDQTEGPRIHVEYIEVDE